MCNVVVVFFLCKQKTAYEMRISDWSSDVCSSDLKLIRQHRVDIIHARSRAPAWSAMIAARRTGCRFVTTFHGAYSLGSRLKHRYNAVMTKGDRVIAVSDFIADHICTHYEVDPDRLRVIHRGVDLWLFDPERMTGHRVVQLAQQ